MIYAIFYWVSILNTLFCERSHSYTYIQDDIRYRSATAVESSITEDDICAYTQYFIIIIILPPYRVLTNYFFRMLGFHVCSPYEVQSSFCFVILCVFCIQCYRRLSEKLAKKLLYYYCKYNKILFGTSYLCLRSPSSNNFLFSGVCSLYSMCSMTFQTMLLHEYVRVLQIRSAPVFVYECVRVCVYVYICMYGVRSCRTFVIRRQ